MEFSFSLSIIYFLCACMCASVSYLNPSYARIEILVGRTRAMRGKFNFLVDSLNGKTNEKMLILELVILRYGNISGVGTIIRGQKKAKHTAQNTAQGTAKNTSMCKETMETEMILLIARMLV